MDSVEHDWKESILALLEKTLGTEECPYFYIHTHQWTALIISKTVDPSAEDRAFIGPTTFGLRDMLNRAGITFKMPLKPSDHEGDQSNDT